MVDRPPEFLDGEWLGKTSLPVFLQEILESIADHITRHENDAVGGIWINVGNSLVELRAAEAGHLPVANEEFVLALRDPIESGMSISNGIDMEAVALQNLGDQLQNPFFVINHQDAPAHTEDSIMIGRECADARSFERKILLPGEFDDERCTLARFTVGGDVSTMFVNNAVAET